MRIAGEKVAHYIKPMLATSVDRPFSSSDWLFELKLDGYRAIAEIKKRELFLYSRNGVSFARQYPTIFTALKKIKVNATLDGEIVLLNDKGKPDFQKLQNYDKNAGYKLVYYVFDLLSLTGKDLTQVTLLERKLLLKKLLRKTDPVIYCNHIETRGEELFEVVKKDDMEGIISKRKDSYYFPGIRTKDWLKIKNHKSQEAVIAGFTQPKGSRNFFGSLLLGQYKNKKLVYAGHAGTGFSEATLTGLMKKMTPLITNKSPFDVPVKTNGPVTWIKPKLVCEISYSEITKDGIMRHPVYKGLRPEKKSKMIQQETERSLPVKKIIKQLSKK